MKFKLKTELPALILCLIIWFLGIYYYTVFPDRVITHWNFHGIADGYSSKTLGAFLVPIITTLFYCLFLALPYLDPKKENYAKFENIYHIFKNVFLVFFLILFIITSEINLGKNIPVNLVVPGMVGLLFIFIGSLIGKVKQNWFMGFRFPWSLSSETVWNKTNRFGGWSMIFCGGLILLSPMFPENVGVGLFFLGILQMVFGTMIYSYLVFKGEQKNLPKKS